jgi:hypothetical protein
VNREFSPGKVRKVAQRLKQIPWNPASAYNRAVAPQEALDYLAMLSGLKPVYVLGRGFDDPAWIRGIREISVDLGLYVLDGLPLRPPEREGPLPVWFREYIRSREPRRVVSYVARLEKVAAEMLLLSQSGEAEEADEARLLGYPECCVRFHHDALRRIAEAEYAIALRDCGGDPERLRARLREGVSIQARSEEEARALEPDWVMAPFTSVFLCADCQASDQSPGRRLSGRMERLASRIDPGLHAILLQIAQRSPLHRDKPSGTAPTAR